MTEVEARDLTPEQCKAILVTRAVLEAAEKIEIHANFKVDRVSDDWHVTVFYTVSPGQVSPVGNFTSVVLKSDWTVKRIVGGA